MVATRLVFPGSQAADVTPSTGLARAGKTRLPSVYPPATFTIEFVARLAPTDFNNMNTGTIIICLNLQFISEN